MPLLINVGLNRKASKDFQSAGVSLNLTAELDQGLLTDPPRLQSEIDRIYAQAEEALERQITAMSTQQVRGSLTQQATGSSRAQTAPANPAATANGKFENGSRNGNGVRPATESQLRALRAICKRGRLDLDHEAHDEFGVSSAEQIDVKHASQLIDILKGRQHEASPQRRWA